MEKRKQTTIILVSLVITSFIFFGLIKHKINSAGVVIITVDDISPAYSLEKHKKLFSVLNKYNVPATLFVIPNFQGKYPVTQNQGWIDLVKKQQDKGWEIAQHGWEHTDHEFGLLGYHQAEEKLLNGKKILEQVFGPFCGFRPPHWAENYEVKKALKDFGYCYDANVYAIPFEHGGKTISWTTEFISTEAEYELLTKVGKPFIIVLHVQEMNSQGYKYLEEFLSFAQKRKATFKTYRDVYGRK